MAADPEYLAYQRALYEALAGVSVSIRDAPPQLVLDRLTAAAITASGGREAALPVLTPLADVAAENSLDAAVARARQRFPTAQAFREAIYCARCIGRDANGALALLAGRAYLETAVLAPDLAHLRTDREAVLDTATFATLWTEPERLDGLLNLIDLWKRDYLRAYLRGHAAYHAALAPVVDQIDGLQNAALALERLNGLRRLGPPLAVAALQRYRELERLFPCTSDEDALRNDLAAATVCAGCGFALGDQPPAAEARQVAQTLDRGLAGQQARLARRVVTRLLARPALDGEARLRRFIEVVQAADLAGLTLVLDDDLVRFLDDLLADQPAAGVLEALAQRYPQVTAGNIEAVVATLRDLLREQVERTGIVRLLGTDEPR